MYSVPKIICIIFHNGSNYYCHFAIKELAEESKKQFTCSGDNTEKINKLYSSNRRRSYNS